MNRYTKVKAISIIMIITIIFIAGQYHEAALDKTVHVLADSKAELERYKESLEDNVEELRSELTCKTNELTDLDRKLIELEIQYNKLLEERKRIADRLEAIKGAQ